MHTISSTRGFTQIELIMVMVVLGVLAAVTASRWNPGDSTAPYQADLLARNIRHMQMLAMTWGQSLQLTVATPVYSVSCVTTTAMSPCNATPVIDPATGSAFSTTLAHNVSLAGATLQIDSLGRPVNAGSLLTVNRVFTLSAGSETWTVTVSPVTGYVVVSGP